MRSLIYLLFTSLKNSLKDLIKRPGRLILYAVIVGFIVMSISQSLQPQVTFNEEFPLYILQGGIFLYLTLMLVMSIQMGLSSGGAIFDMSDANLLFVSPLNPRLILIYGIIKLAKTSVYGAIFVFFFGGIFAMFGVGFDGLLAFFATFIVCAIVQALLSLVIYSKTNGRPQRKNAVRIIAIMCFVPLAIYLLWQFVAMGDVLLAVQSAVESPFLACIPVSGWATAAMAAFFGGDMVGFFMWSGLLLLVAVAMIVFVMKSDFDYYEDVLVATETAFERKRAIAEGDMQMATASTRKARVTKTGIKGWGASTFFYKHLREIFRENRFGFFGISTLSVFAVILVMYFALSEDMNLSVVLIFLMMFQIMLIGTGSGLKEIYTHYIYLVPESPWKKLVWSNMTTVLKTLIEGFLYLGVLGILLGENPLIIVFAVLAYTAFSLFLLGVNYVSLRWTQTNMSQGILLLVYFLVVLVLWAPGLVGFLALMLILGELLGVMVGLAVLIVWELLIASLLFYLARNVLSDYDMPTMNSLG